MVCRCQPGGLENPGGHQVSALQCQLRGGNRVVFNIIKGNSYRLLVALHYNRGLMYVRFFGTHAEYNAISVDRI